MTNASMNRGGVNSLQVSVTMAKLKQQIANLQNQIAAQQAVYMKQQSSVHASAAINAASNEFLRGTHDSINALQGSFADISMNKVK